MKKTFAWAVLGLGTLSGIAAAQTAAERLERKVQEISDQVSRAFVFFPGGSGVFISKNGLALTNHHVAGAQKSVRVWLFDGRQLRATNVCTDSVGDIALFKVEGLDGDVPCLEFGDSDRLQVGQYVLAVGNPFGVAGVTPTNQWYPSVSLGIVSALHRYQQQYSDCIQTDAAVNPGNSGGPLVNLLGELVGINGRIATRYFNRVNSGVGYAISSNQIKNFLPEMKKGGKSGRVYHGQVQGLEFSRHHQNGAGALVTGVKPDSAAEKAGFEREDRIVKLNEYAIFSADRFRGVLGTYPEGTTVAVTVRRDDAEVTLEIGLDRYDGADILGFRPRSDRPESGGYLGVVMEDREEGVQVTMVIPGSPADDAGVQVDDLILQFDGRAVKDRGDLVSRIQAKKPGVRVTLKMQRAGETMEIEVTLGKRP